MQLCTSLLLLAPVSGDVQLVELHFQPPIILNRLAAAAKTAGDSQIETD